jgi:hypothetical protein
MPYNERRNPDYANAVRMDNTIDAPLFDSVQSGPVVHPAPVLRDSLTSREAWYELRASGTIDRRQEQVLQVISDLGPITSQRIAEELHFPINCVTGRIVELRDMMMLIEEAGAIVEEGSTRKRMQYKIRPQ